MNTTKYEVFRDLENSVKLKLCRTMSLATNMQSNRFWRILGTNGKKKLILLGKKIAQDINSKTYLKSTFGN